MLAASLVNLLATATITQSSQASGYPASNVTDDAHPDIPWRTTATTAQWIEFDLGSAKTFDELTDLYTNYTSVRWRANTSSSWGGATPYDSGFVMVGVNPCQGRYCRIERPTAPQTYRFVRMDIPAQTPTDGAAYFRTGALHLGALSLYRNFTWDFHPRRTQERVLNRTVGGTEEQLLLGPARGLLTGTLKPLTRFKADETASSTTLLDDQVADLLVFAQAWSDAGKALIHFLPDHPYWVAMMRQVSEIDPSVNLTYADWPFEWREVS